MAPARAVLKTDTAVTTGTCYAILVVANTVFTTLTGMAGNSVAGVTFPAGVTLYGNFSTVTLASGSVVCYFAN